MEESRKILVKINIIDGNEHEGVVVLYSKR